jgi:hypothetical protein
VVAGQALQSAPTTVESKENVLNGRGDEETRRQGEANPVSTNPVGANGIRPATEDTQPQVLQTLESHAPHPIPQPPIPEDDDEEVSWQSAARASLEKETKPSNVKSSSIPIARKVESQSQNVPAKSVEARATPQPIPEPQTPNPEPPPPTLNPQLPEAQFTKEELPADFWGNESEPPPPSSYDDDEAFETATSVPSGNGQNGKARATSKSSAKLPFDMPLFNELQALFPGRIVRIDIKQQKESEAQTNEAENVAESEDTEG